MLPLLPLLLLLCEEMETIPAVVGEPRPYFSWLLHQIAVICHGLSRPINTPKDPLGIRGMIDAAGLLVRGRPARCGASWRCTDGARRCRDGVEVRVERTATGRGAQRLATVPV